MVVNTELRRCRERQQAAESKEQGGNTVPPGHGKEWHHGNRGSGADALSIRWTDEAWAVRAPLIPGVTPGGRPREMERRAIVYAMVSVLRNGCPWRMVPHDGPRWLTASWSVRRWTPEGMWEPVHAALRRARRVSGGREAEPRAAIRERPSITRRAVRGDARGSDGGHNMRGSTRHRLVETEGWLQSVNVLAAEPDDREGGCGRLLPLVGKRPRLPVIRVERGSAGSPCKLWGKDHLGVRLVMVTHPWTGMRGVWVPEGVEIDGEQSTPNGFHMRPRRWVGERTHAWIPLCCRLSRAGEGTPASSEACLSLSRSEEAHGHQTCSRSSLIGAFLDTF